MEHDIAMNNNSNSNNNVQSETRADGVGPPDRVGLTGEDPSLAPQGGQGQKADKNKKQRNFSSLERRLFEAIRQKPQPLQQQQQQSCLLSVKEFDESYAFVNGVRSSLPKYLTRKTTSTSSSSTSTAPKQNDDDNSHQNIQLVLDVAGGHGAVAALFLILTSAQTACVIDPAKVGNVASAWSSFLSSKTLAYRHECLRTGLPQELHRAIHQQKMNPQRILVVACHACQHLSQETIQIAQQFGCHVAVAPCCQTDKAFAPTSWKTTARQLNVDFATVMDLLLAGQSTSRTLPGDDNLDMSNSQQGEPRRQPYAYNVRIKVMDASITPQNRIIVCRRLHQDNEQKQQQKLLNQAHQRLQRAYLKAHGGQAKDSRSARTAPRSTSSSDELEKNDTRAAMEMSQEKGKIRKSQNERREPTLSDSSASALVNNATRKAYNNHNNDGHKSTANDFYNGWLQGFGVGLVVALGVSQFILLRHPTSRGRG